MSRRPQSVQSCPKLHLLVSAPGPPSSHEPSPSMALRRCKHSMGSSSHVQSSKHMPPGDAGGGGSSGRGLAGHGDGGGP